MQRSGEVGVVDDYGRERERYKIPYGAVLSVQEGSKITAGDIIVTWDPFTHPVITEVDGIVELKDFIDGVTVQKQSDEVTGLSSLVVTDPKQRGSAGKELRPMVKLSDSEGNTIYLPGTEIPAQYFLPAGAIAGSLVLRASNKSATRGRPPVISLVLLDSCGILAKTSPTRTSPPSLIPAIAPAGKKYCAGISVPGK